MIFLSNPSEILVSTGDDFTLPKTVVSLFKPLLKFTMARSSPEDGLHSSARKKSTLPEGLSNTLYLHWRDFINNFSESYFTLVLQYTVWQMMTSVAVQYIYINLILVDPSIISKHVSVKMMESKQ